MTDGKNGKQPMLVGALIGAMVWAIAATMVAYHYWQMVKQP